MENNNGPSHPGYTWVSLWLLAGLILVLGQISIGGITRLTGSGLSITKWEIVTGTLPPLNNQEWDAAFELYKSTPQYRLVNKGMSLSEFKFIYFWEYFHRLWARMMGFVFLIPFIVFWRKGWINKALGSSLGKLVLLAMLTASFGWIMVASGLVERPWVNTYKLGLHLLLGFAVFIYLFRVWTSYIHFSPGLVLPAREKSYLLLLVGLITVQVFLGALVSGMHAGYSFPTWPDMNGVFLPEVLMDKENWDSSNFIDYDGNLFMLALVQFMHRSVAYIIVLIGLYLFIRLYKKGFSVEAMVGMGLLVIQVFLGILTVLGFKSGLPIFLASIHQIVALFLLTWVVHLGTERLPLYLKNS